MKLVERIANALGLRPSRYSPRIVVATVETWGGNCPFQIEGRDTTGRPFYLRARHEHLAVTLGNPGDHDGVGGVCVFEVAHPEDSEEWGWVDLHDVVKVTGGFIRWPLWLRLRAQWEGAWSVNKYRTWKMIRNVRQLNAMLEKRKP